ncbi:MAG TPA: vitamin K epoxide reductase family protein [Tepidisphaeraceae bacterium]
MMQVVPGGQLSLAVSTVIFNSLALGGSALALLINGWIFRNGISAKGLPGCGKDSGCDAVLRGRWSKLGSIPVSALGAAVCLIQLILALAAGETFDGRFHDVRQNAAVVVALVIIGAGFWYVALQVFVVRRLCFYCIASHACGMTASACILASISPWNTAKFSIECLIASASVAALISGQILWKPRLFAVVPVLDAAPRPTENEAPLAPVALQPAVPAQMGRVVSLNSGRVTFRVGEFPLLGSDDAEHVIGCLFDFSCHECHHMHQLLFKLVEHYGGRLAIACIPTPLSPRCNPVIKKQNDEQKFACAYARLALGLWITRPSSYAEWDRYMIEEMPCRSLDEAIERANELAEIGGFNISDAEPIVDERIAAAVEIYRLAETPNLPTLLLPHGMLLGRVENLETLIEQVDHHV